MKRVAIYLRVSTSKQDTDNQRRELEAVAARSGWHVERVYEDAGISGANGRDKRPGLDRRAHPVLRAPGRARRGGLLPQGRGVTTAAGTLSAARSAAGPQPRDIRCTDRRRA